MTIRLCISTEGARALFGLCSSFGKWLFGPPPFAFNGISTSWSGKGSISWSLSIPAMTFFPVEIDG